MPREVMFEVLAQTPLAAQAKRRRPMVESGDYSASFRLSLARKDMDLVAETAHRAGLHLRLDEAARSWLLDAEHDGRGHQDYTAIIATIQEGLRPQANRFVGLRFANAVLTGGAWCEGW